MASIRLTEELRAALKALVCEKVDFPEFDREEQTARKKLCATFDAVIRRQFPPRDMKVLKKYDHACIPFRFTVVLNAGRHVDPHSTYNGAVAFDREHAYQTKLWVPTGGGIRLLFNADEAKIYEAWEAAQVKRRAAREKGQADYFTLIKQSRTLEQVEKVWPAAKAVRTKFNRSLPVIVLDDVIKRIVADQQARAAA